MNTPDAMIVCMLAAAAVCFLLDAFSAPNPFRRRVNVRRNVPSRMFWLLVVNKSFERVK